MQERKYIQRFLSKQRKKNGNEGFVNNRPHSCGRLISWLNNTGGLCSSFILIGPFYFTIQRSWPPRRCSFFNTLVSRPNDRNPIFHCHRRSAFSPGEISTAGENIVVLSVSWSSSDRLISSPRSRLDRHKLQSV